MNTKGQQGHKKLSKREYYAAAVMLLLGLGAVWKGSSYKIGTLTNMGPGLFPVTLGVTLTFLGAAIALGAKSAAMHEQEEQHPAEWRGWVCIVFSIVAFVVVGRYGGLLPATFAIVFISALGDRQNSIKSAAALASAVVVICLVIFWWALRLQFPLFGWG